MFLHGRGRVFNLKTTPGFLYSFDAQSASLPSFVRVLVLGIDALYCTCPRFGATSDLRDDEDEKVRGVCDEEPGWWGRGMTVEVETSYEEEVSPYTVHVGEASFTRTDHNLQ